MNALDNIFATLFAILILIVAPVMSLHDLYLKMTETEIQRKVLVPEGEQGKSLSEYFFVGDEGLEEYEGVFGKWVSGSEY